MGEKISIIKAESTCLAQLILKFTLHAGAAVAALVAAKLNILIGNPYSCVSDTVLEADAWMATYGPVGSGVRANSDAWKIGEPLYLILDDYNNGLLCAPHRD